MKPASVVDDKRASEEDELPSTSARFRLKMTADGQLVPEIIPVDDDALRDDPALKR